LTIFLLCILGYLLGSIPFGLILTRYAGLGDIRAIGSGNIGATNVLRTGHKKLATATLLLDGFKGTLAVLIASHFHDPAPYCASFAAFLGHLFPVWLKFRGGKGVATGLGVLLGAYAPLFLLAAAAWLLIAALFRYSSLAALTAFAITPLAALLIGQTTLATLSLLIAALIFYKHAPNISRLLAGTEPKIGNRT
jgi:glycerol-3-phosphate acyltransferase PlsY